MPKNVKRRPKDGEEIHGELMRKFIHFHYDHIIVQMGRWDQREYDTVERIVEKMCPDDLNGEDCEDIIALVEDIIGISPKKFASKARISYEGEDEPVVVKIAGTTVRLFNSLESIEKYADMLYDAAENKDLYGFEQSENLATIGW